VVTKTVLGIVKVSIFVLVDVKNIVVVLNAALVGLKDDDVGAADETWYDVTKLDVGSAESTIVCVIVSVTS